jgi:hypothetical protein
LATAFLAVSYFTVLPSPREVSPINLRRLSLTTLQVLDSDYDLSRAAFEIENPAIQDKLQVALSASLPSDVVYNLTVYDINDGEGPVYNKAYSISNAESLSASSDVATYTVASSNVTFNVQPEKIGEQNGGTLYILNCSDANGWWITGYTAHSLAQDLYNLLSQYFVNTIMVQNTGQLRQILDGTPLQGETIQNAVIINTCGEAVPIPTYYATQYSSDLAQYNYLLGQKVRTYNWTWASIVGYPFYYLSNTASFSDRQNDWGIYGMRQIGGGGSIAFLRGLNSQSYSTAGTGITDSKDRQVTFTEDVEDLCNYYGIYPSTYQTSTRALSYTVLSGYNLQVGLNIFNPSGDYLAGAIYNHYATGSTDITGSFLALGLTRTPDVRVTAVSLLSYYQPRLYASEYTAKGTSRLVVLQLGMVGGA